MRIPEPLSHAYIITGGCESGRAEFADRLAAAYLCEAGPQSCGRCRSCRKLAARAHPDVIRVTLAEDKREITVDQARAMRSDVYVLPNEGKRKVYIIDPADSMNDSAQNALLKVLEEGPDYGAFLLLSSEPGNLLETVRSRCETLALPPEEEQADPAFLEQAEELAELLLTGSELQVAEGVTALEQEKLKSGRLIDLLALTERSVSRRLTQYPKRGAVLLRALKQCRENSVYNLAAGHTLGWLAAELFH